MKKSMLACAFAAVAALTAAGGAGIASASPTPVPQSAQYTSSGSDGGSCGDTWGLDLSNRMFSQPAPDPAGNYSIVEKFMNGHFSTSFGVSPGACNGAADGSGFTPNNGHRVVEGLNGSWSGNEHLFIIGGVFTAGDASCNGHSSSDTANPCTTGSYVAYHYGTGASFTVTTFDFSYKTGDKRAQGTKTWHEHGDISFAGGAEVDSGDIYTS